MAEVCKICGLPKDLCVCVSIAKGETKIKVYTEKRRFNKKTTVVEGIEKESNPDKVAKLLKSKLACGGTFKEGRIELQGDHKSKIKKILIENGFDEANIEVD
ncbi:MAG: stress response translation initiation inhibitor YciH [Candidatus Aenigmarchaeota archaeon]|nr:stress response translation initiation inhibitor YciH [Candidatus Aenigmarchaeota archaeon]